MKKNEKLLAIGLGLVVAGYFGWPMIRSVLIDPVEQLEADRDAARTAVAAEEEKNTEVLLAAKRLSDWKRQSLPGDELDAQRLYQQWLTDLTVASGLSAKVSPHTRSPKRGVYTAVQVQLEGQAKFKDLQDFLRRFHAVDLLQRVAYFKADSPAADGDPLLKFSITAEGLNLAGAPKRNSVFPQHELEEALSASATELTLPAKEFKAKPGDLVRLGTEFAAVTKIDGDRVRLTRGADGTTAADHPAGTIAELFPLMKPDPKVGIGPNALSIAKIDSPFVKPRKYDPKIDGLADQKLVRGTPLKATVKVADYDASAGKPKLELASGPKGLTLDPATGELAWSPPADLPNGEYKVALAADLPAPKKRIEKTVTITLGDPNAPPKFEEVALSDVFLGEKVDLPIKAIDPENAGTVAYKLDTGPPGATVDPATGDFKWDIPKNFNPGDVTVTVSATDKGDPPQTTQKNFTIKVQENLKPFVKLVGAGSDSQPWAWLYDQASNRNLRLHPGENFKAAGLEAKVREIGQDFMTFERNGHVWRIRLGQHLDEVEKLADEPTAETSPVSAERPVEAPKPQPRPADEPRRPASAAGDRPAAS
jgi:hypothetical protein